MLKNFYMLVFLILHSVGTAQNIWFSDEFNTTKLGDAWLVISGKSNAVNGRLKLEATDKPSLLALNLLIPPKSTYTIKFAFFGDEIYLMFNVYDVFLIRAGNYVKFFNDVIYTGVIEPTGEERIGKFASLLRSKDKWKTITVDVSPGKYTVYFNDRRIFEENLYFNSGFIILGTSRGKVDIDYFIISSREKYRTIEEIKKVKEALIDHINSIALIDPSKFAISSDVYSHVQVLDTLGNVLNRFTYLRWVGGIMHYNEGLYICDAGKITIVYPDRTTNVAQFVVKYPNHISTDGEKFYVIDNGAIKIFDRNFKLISSFADPVNLKFPTAIAVDKYNIYCADPELGVLSIYSKRDTIRFVGKLREPLIMPVDIKYDSISNSFFVADVGLKSIVKLSNNKVEKVFKAENLGGLKLPRSIDIKSGLIFIADADKIVRVDTTLSEASSKLILKK